MPDRPVIIAARRTPIGTAGHSLATVTAADLGAAALQAVAAQVDRSPAEVVLGNCMGPGGDIARVATLAAGLPTSTPAVTVDRQCASGLAAIEIGARLVREDHWPVLAGGTESASTAPWRFWPPTGDAPPQRYERAPFAPPPDDPDMGVAADRLAAEYGITRQRQDAYAARSHRLPVAAAEAGAFADELVAVAGVTRDDRPRAGLTEAKLARLRPAFDPAGTVTVGTSCGVNDGAAAVALAPGSAGLPGLRVLGAASVGVDPNRPGIGLVPLRIGSRQTGGERRVVGMVGEEHAALALGHPWGASGAVLVVRLFTQLVRQSAGRYGLAAIAAGGGQGTALVVEACR